MPKITALPGIYVSDLWARDSRKHGRRWWFLVRVRGRSMSRAFAHEDKSVGKRWATKARADLEREDFAPTPALLNDVLKSHLTRLRGTPDSGKRGGRSHGRTGRSDEHIADVERIVKMLIAKGVTDLRKPDVLSKAQAFVDALDVAPVTRLRSAAHLKAVGETARKLHRMTMNPFGDVSVDVPELGAPATFTVEQCRLLASDKSIGASYGLMVALALYAGLRLRECAWLRWEDVRPDDEAILVDPPTDEEREQGARLKRNKRRSALLMSELAAILEAHRPAKGEEGYIMPAAIRPWDTQQHGRAFKKHLAALKIDKGERHFHSLRHTFAGLALAAGVDGMKLQMSMGHSAAAVTKHYAQTAQRLRAAVREWPHGEITLRTPNMVEMAVGNR